MSVPHISIQSALRNTVPGVLALLNCAQHWYHLRTLQYPKAFRCGANEMSIGFMSVPIHTADAAIGSAKPRWYSARRFALAVLALGLVFAGFTKPSAAQAKPGQKAQKGLAAKPAQTATNRLVGTWRVTRGMVAPWVTDKNYHPDTSSWIGKTIRFDAARVTGPEALNCGNARYEATSVPAEGMFQGTLTKSASAEAMRVGVSKFPIAGTSLTCDTGIFEFHFPDSTSALLAMSNAIWTLDRSPGAMASATSPAGVVQRFLEAHFAREMGFSKIAMQRKMRFVTTSLYALMTRYFAMPANPNEAPVINGDPFTNSQEYPTRFSVEAVSGEGSPSTVRVRFSDAARVESVTYQLRRENNVWRIDDVKYRDGASLRAQLTAALPSK
jgi:hypothetical protein